MGIQYLCQHLYRVQNPSPSLFFSNETPIYREERGEFLVDSLTLDVPPLLGSFDLACASVKHLLKATCLISHCRREGQQEKEIATVGFCICQVLYITCK